MDARSLAEAARAFRAEVVLRDGTPVEFRAITPGDKVIIADGFARMSPESRFRRFMGPKDELTQADLAYLTEIDYVDHFAIGALIREDGVRRGIGVARYVRLPDQPATAEAAVAVVDDYQGRGLGTLMLEALVPFALAAKIDTFVGYMLESNRPIIEILRRLGAHLEHDAPGAMRMELSLPEHADDLKGTPLYDVLRAVARGEVPPPRAPGRD